MTERRVAKDKTTHFSHLVSICLSTYNKGHVLHEAIDSLLTQTYNHFELIISDDASIDNTQKICEEYAQKDKRIRYFRHDVNIGAIKNFAFVLNKAQGEYFMLACDDDIWEQDFILRLMELYQRREDIILALCIHDITDFTGVILENNSLFFSEEEYLTAYQRFKKFLLHRGPKSSYYHGIFKKKYVRDRLITYKAVKSVPDYYSAHDTLALLELLTRGSFVSVPQKLYHKRQDIYVARPEKALRNLTFITNKGLYIDRLINFIKTPYYRLVSYIAINSVIKKSFPYFYDRFRLYIFNAYIFLIKLLKIIPRTITLSLNLLLGLLSVFKQKIKL